MKTHFLNSVKALFGATILSIALITNLAFAQDGEPISSNKKIRFYKVNKDMQGDRIMLGNKKSSQAGCHNFIKQVRVHRAVQTGYIACSLYESKNCPLASVVPAAREKDPRRTYLLTEGFGWLPQSEEERGVKVKSWKCHLDLEADLLGHDSQLAKTEVIRLRIAASKAKERLERAQKKADKAERVSKDAIEAAKTSLKRAVKAGYEPPPELGKRIGEDDDSEESESDDSDKEEKSKKEK